MGHNIKSLATGLDVRPLLEQIGVRHKLFEQFKQRQETPGSPHKDTMTIFLRWCEDKTVEAAFSQLPAIDYPAYAMLPEARPLVEKVMEITGATELGRVIITMLKPGGVILKHVDEGAYADHYERFHICLQAARGNVLSVAYEDHPKMGEMIDPDHGELFWFNHKSWHLCVNPTQHARIHLIVDAVAPKYRRERVLPPQVAPEAN